MDKIFEFLGKYNWKHWLTVILLALAALVSSFFLSSCSLINRSSASGSRKVEKTVIQEQEWNIPAQSSQSTVYKQKTTTTKKRS